MRHLEGRGYAAATDAREGQRRTVRAPAGVRRRAGRGAHSGPNDHALVCLLGTLGLRGMRGRRSRHQRHPVRVRLRAAVRERQGGQARPHPVAAPVAASGAGGDRRPRHRADPADPHPAADGPLRNRMRPAGTRQYGSSTSGPVETSSPSTTCTSARTPATAASAATQARPRSAPGCRGPPEGSTRQASADPPGSAPRRTAGRRVGNPGSRLASSPRAARSATWRPAEPARGRRGEGRGRTRTPSRSRSRAGARAGT